MSGFYLGLPVVMGIYAILPKSKRAWVLAVLNLAFAAVNGLKGFAVFLVLFACAYFSGIYIYNTRNNEKKYHAKRAILTLNVVLNAAALLFLTSPAKIPLGSLSAFAMFGAAVFPLHLISYLTDVYRGDCAAQTRVSALLAYAAFFPCAQMGPVLKYKNFKKSFCTPEVTRQKVSSGIAVLLCGIAESEIVAARLSDVRDEFLTLNREQTGSAGWLYIPIFYALFGISVMGAVHVGKGLAAMLGFSVKPCFRRKFMSQSLADRIKTFNTPLVAWFYDYVYKPLSGVSDLAAACAPVAALCLIGLWYKFSIYCLFAAVLAAFFIGVQRFTKNRAVKRLPKWLRCVITKLMIGLITTICAIADLGYIPKTDFNSDITAYILRSAAVPVVIAYIITGALLSTFLRLCNRTFLRISLPLIELLLLFLCTAFLIHNS